MNHPVPDSNEYKALLQKLDALTARNEELEALYRDTNKALLSAQAKADRLEEYVYNLEESLKLIENSNGHKLLNKYYDLVRKVKTAVTTVKNALLGIIGAPKAFISKLKRRRANILTHDECVDMLKSCTRIDILAAEGDSDAAKALQSILRARSISCDIHSEESSKYASIPYIIFSPHSFRSFPALYMAFQTADFSKRLLSEEEMTPLLNAYAVFDFSLDNIELLSTDSRLTKKLYYLPVYESPEATEFYLNRFLLANDRISFEEFYQSSGSFVRFDSDRICLSLPETTLRRAAFDADNRYGFQVIPGLKHNIGWIGCGMSYKFIFRKALEQGFEKLLVCEDDVYFPPDFDARFHEILRFCDSHKDWNIFSGIMAELGDASILDCVNYGDEEFVYLNRMMSMVFNIYDKSVFDIICQWDNTILDKQTNTIDRYLEDKITRVLTTCPFLVGHKEDLNSTIWNHKNDLYNPGIENCSKKLHLLLDAYHYNNKNK